MLKLTKSSQSKTKVNIDMNVVLDEKLNKANTFNQLKKKHLNITV